MTRLEQLRADCAFLDQHAMRVMELMEALRREINREETVPSGWATAND